MFALIIYSIFLVSCHGISIGTTDQTRFTSVDRLNSGTVWINNQSSSSQCLCTVLSQYPNVLLFNRYRNGSCQLFFSLPFTYTMEYNTNSTITFLSQLPPVNQAPCCSNISWLLSRINNLTSISTFGASAKYLAIDGLDYLVVLNANYSLLRYNRTTKTVVSSSYIPDAVALSYYNKQYFITLNSSQLPQLNIYSATDLTTLANISIPYAPTDYAFIRNGTIMLAAIRSANTIAFFNVTSPTSYIPIFNLSAPSSPYTLYTVNDTLLYMATNLTSDPIYVLSYSISTSNWIWSNLNVTRSNSTTSNSRLMMDSCGRMWVSVNPHGVRIYNTYGTKLLASWPWSYYYGDVALSEEFEFYVTSVLTNRITDDSSGITQCTS